jgi:hypothetical protein
MLPMTLFTGLFIKLIRPAYSKNTFNNINSLSEPQSKQILSIVIVELIAVPNLLSIKRINMSHSSISIVNTADLALQR